MANKKKTKSSTMSYELNYPEPKPIYDEISLSCLAPLSTVDLADMYQSVIVTFSDGTIGTFTGPAVIHPKLLDDVLCVVDVKFTMPKSLPSDCKFGPI